MDFLQFVGRGYGQAWRGLLFRQTFPQFKDIIAKSRKWIPQLFPGARYNATEHHWTFPAGEQLFFVQFARAVDYDNFHGMEFPWIAWEELCNWSSPDIGYKRMISVCRSSHKEVPRHYRATTNPYGVGHNWVKRRFRLSGIPEAGPGQLIMDSVDEKGNLEKPRISIHGELDENKILLAAEPDYKMNLRTAARNESELKAWLFGSWDIVAGGMFDDVWDQDIHVVKPFVIPHSWRVDRAFDWGSSKPFSVGWYAESDGSDLRLLNSDKVVATVRGDTFRFAEWYGCRAGRDNEGLRLLASQVAEGIVKRELRWKILNRTKAGPADTAIYTAENGRSIASDMAGPVRLDGVRYRGVHWTRADKRPGSRKTGWEKIREMMHAAIPIEKGAAREKPGLFVTENCKEFLRTVPVLPRDDEDLDDVDTDSEDHIGDELRYRVRFKGTRPSEGRTVGMF